jgi:tetratricopeptide (TPR) repeat protein
MIAGIAFFLHQALDFEFYLPSVTVPGFAVLALAIGAQKKDKVYCVTVKENRRTLCIVIGFAVTMTASLLLLVPFYGQIYFQRGRNLLTLRPDLAEEAAADIQKAIRLDPHNSQYHHHYGVLLVQRLSRQQEGIAEVQEAIRLSPWQHYYHFDLGMIYFLSGAWDKGLEEIKKASHLYPLDEDYHQWLRGLYLKIGKKALASQEEQWIETIRRERGDQKDLQE